MPSPVLRKPFAAAIALAIAVNPAAYGAAIKWLGSPAKNSTDWNNSANWSGNALPNATSDVTINPGTAVLDVNAVIDSLDLGATSLLTIGSGNTLTVGSPATIGPDLVNFGKLNVNNNANLNVDVTHSGPLNYGTLNLAAGSTMTLTNAGSNTGPAYNLGTANIGSGTGEASLLLSNTSGNSSATFDLAGTGRFLLSNSSNNTIAGVQGNEILVNDTTIEGAGTINNLASFTNNRDGELWASGSQGLKVSSTLTNWNAATLTLAGGTYEADSTLTLSSIGNSAIGTLSNATVTITGSGNITGNGSANALGALNNITGSVLNLTGTSPMTIAPTSGTLNVAASDALFKSAALNVSGSQIAVNGALSLTGGSVTTATVSVSNGGMLFAAGLSNAGNISVDGASTANFSSGNFTNLSGGTLNGGSYQIAGNFVYSGGDITTIGANTNVELDGAGKITYGSAVNGLANLATNNGTLTLNQDAAGNVASLALQGQLAQNGSLNIMNGSTLTAQGVNNQGSIYIDTGGLTPSTADFSGGKFANLSAGTLSGGTYQIGGNFIYAASQGGIQTIAANTNLELDGAGQMLAGNTNGLASLTSNQGNLTISQSASLTTLGSLGQTAGTMSLSLGGTLTVGGTFSQDAASQTALTGSTLNALGFRNQGFLSVDSTSVANFASGNMGTFANLSPNGTLSGGTYQIAGSFIYDPYSAPNPVTGNAGGDILKIGTGTTLAIDGSGSMTYTSTGGTVQNGLANLAANSGTLMLGIDNNGFGATLALNGGLSQTGGKLTLNSSSLTLGGQFTQDSLSSTQVLNSSTLTALGLSNAGSIVVDSSSIASFATGTATGTFANLSAAGTLTGGSYQIAGSFVYDPYAVANGSNAGGDILKIGTGTSVEIDGYGSMTYTSTDGLQQDVNGLANLAVNSGTLILSSDDQGNPGSMSVNGDLAQQGGTLEIEDGSTFSVAGQFSQDTASTTYIDASSTLQAGDGFVNQGTLAGVGTIDGDYDQTASGMLVLDFFGSGPGSYDSLFVNGNVALDGTVEIDLVDGFTPVAGDEFTILTWTGSLTGDFSNLDFAPLTDGLKFTETIGNNAITLDVVAPEPSTMALTVPVLLGLAVVWNARRRRSTAR